MSECLPDMPRFIRQNGDEWQGADHIDGPWRPIATPQSGLPLPVPSLDKESPVTQPSEADRAALAAEPEVPRPTDEELLETAAKSLGYKHIPSDENCLTAEASELLDFARAVLARWGRPVVPPLHQVVPPAPEPVGEFVMWLRNHASANGRIQREQFTRAATLLQQQAARIAELEGRP